MESAYVAGSYTARRNGKLYTYSGDCWHEQNEVVWQVTVCRNGVTKGQTSDRFDDQFLRDPGFHVRLAIEGVIERRISLAD